MEKIFRVPSECRVLVPYFWGLKHAACDELKQNGINEEPAQAHLAAMQKICDSNPWGSLANYVRELKKGFLMEQNELFAYDQKIKELQMPIEKDAPLDFIVTDEDNNVAEDDEFFGGGDFEMNDSEEDDEFDGGDFEMGDSEGGDGVPWQDDVTQL